MGCANRCFLQPNVQLREVPTVLDFRIRLQTSLNEYLDPEEIVGYGGELIALNDEFKDAGEIGWFRLTHISPYDGLAMDEHSAELHAVDVAVSRIDEFEHLKPATIWYLDRLFVKPEYRGKGVGARAVYLLLRYAAQASITGVFVVQAMPLDDRGSPLRVGEELTRSEAQQRLDSLVRFYSRLGLDRIPLLPSNSSAGDIVSEWFYYDLEYILPTPPEGWQGGR